MSLSAVVKNVANTGEGPHWDERTKSLYYIDITAGNVHEWNSLTGEDKCTHLADLVSFAIPRESGGIVASLGLSIATADLNTGAVHNIASIDPNTPECRFNDGKCDRSGRLWTGTMGKEIAPAILEVPKAGCLYSVERDGTFRKRDEKIDLSNGLAWTADDRTMFFIDSTPYIIYAYDFDIATGDATNRRIAIDMTHGISDGWGIPDGCCIDTNDHLWVACYGAGRVMQFDMVTGKPIRTVHIPTALNTSSCCFGGENFDELYVTTMIRGVSFDDQPDAGSVFKITGLGAKGFPAPRFQG